MPVFGEGFLASYEAEQSAFCMPDSLSRRFTLVSCLKYAPGGQVYLLTGADGKPYILRVAPAEAYERLLREHLTLRRLHHPAFPHPVGCFREGNRAYLIREYIPGTPLSELVENGDPMSPARAVKYAQEICAILEELHALDPPVIHRDIKPHNFILTPEGTLCLVDLDAASEYRPDSRFDTVVLGTAATAAPEQFGYRRCDMRTDVYGVGMVLVFLMTGNYDLRSFLKAPIPRAPRRIVKKCVRFDPEMRYPTMARLSRALARWRHDRRVWPLAVLLVLALTLGTAGVGIRQGRIWHALAAGADALSQFADRAGQEEYVFRAPIIESAVRLELGRPQGRITYADLASVKRIFICGDEVYADADELSCYDSKCKLNGEEYTGYGSLDDIADLANMPNLEQIGLSRLHISDLSPLADLRPETLVLCGDEIENLGVISRMTSVVKLYMPGNPLTSLDGIEKMRNLRDLNIGATIVTDLSPLTGTEITALVAFAMPDGIDLSALASVSSLNNLSLQDAPAAQCLCIADMPQLQRLALFYCGITDFSFLADETNLADLIIMGNPCGSLEFLSGLTKLESLDADDCSLADLAGIENLPNLRELSVSNNAKIDLSLLGAMPALEKLYLTRHMEALLPWPADECPFEIAWED